MGRRTLVGIGLGVALALAAPAVAQDQEAAAQERAREQERARQAPPQTQEREKEKEKEAAERERQALERAKAQEQERREREAGQPVNIRLELTIRDQRGSAPGTTKTVTLVTADRSPGRIRTQGNVRTEKFGMQPVTLNVDARPILVGRGDQIRLSMTVEYRPADTETSYSPGVSETIECILVSGQPLVVSKSADPETDRGVTVEVKATILK